MRTILFRGKREDTGEWLYGGFAKVGEDGFILAANIDAAYKSEESTCVPVIPELVIPETVGQYVGMACMDGTLIFEGDILRITPHGDDQSGDADICAVKWQDACLTWALTGIDDAVLCDFSPEDISVIGNIHDNPDLLGV